MLKNQRNANSLNPATIKTAWKGLSVLRFCDFCKKIKSKNNKCQPGISLIEVLLVLALMSATILPFTLLIGQNSQNSRGVYIQSTRSLLQASAADQMDALRSDYYTQFNDTTMTTSLSDLGQTIPYMVKVDTANSDIFNKTAYLYVYTNTTDATSSPRTLHMLFESSDTFRLRCGTSNALMDSSQRFWGGDGNAYDTTKKQPGYVTGTSGTTGSSTSSDIVNTAGVDDGLFQYYREGTSSTNVDYKFDVPNGDYVVSLYFTELSASVTGTAGSRRRMDIYLEGSAVSTAYSPYETTGGTYRANIQSYDVTVSDSVLDISVCRNSGSNYDARISGIVIQKRLVDS
jgi:Tfp pilus assembly protein PilV